MVGCCEIASIVARRLTESQKQHLVEGYRLGDSTTSLAAKYGCSQNTVIRTVKTSLSSDEYNALKNARFKGGSVLTNSSFEEKTSSFNQKQTKPKEGFVQKGQDDARDSNQIRKDSNQTVEEYDLFVGEQVSGILALDDSDDFDEDLQEEAKGLEVSKLNVEESSSIDLFQEVTPLVSDFQEIQSKEVDCTRLGPGILPSVVYMLVDRSVELDARPLKEFTELGLIPKIDQDRQALYLFSNQRSAKRNCGRSQRVIKVPNTDVFGISTPYLLARGITRLVLEGSLIALD